jgi:Tfp pilus assembly protein PilO
MKKIEVGSLSETLTRYQKYQYLLPYLAVGLLILFSFSLLESGWTKIGNLRQANQKQAEEIGILSTRLSQIESISDEDIDSRIKEAIFALPRSKDPLFILSSAKTLAEESKLMIEEISFSPGEIRKDYPTTKSKSGVESISINFSLQGFQEDFLTFASRVNNYSPLMALSNIKLNFEENEGGVIAAKIVGETFFAPVNTGSFSQVTDITLQAQDDLVYQQVLTLEKAKASLVSEEGEFTTFNEDRNPFTTTQTTEVLTEE